MQRIALLVALAISCVSLPTLSEAAAAKKGKKAEAAKPVEKPVEKVEEAPPPPPPKPEPPAPKAENPRLVNSPNPYGTGYESYGTRGGATLEGNPGLRISVFGGNHFFGDGYGYGGFEAMYFFSPGKSVDLGLGVRFSGWALGVAPGAELRWRWVKHGPFHLGLSLAAFVPFTFRGMFGGITVGAHVEPGILGSYFFADNVEFIFGVLVPMTLHVVSFSFPVPQVGFAGRLGVAYTFKKSNVGLFFLHDIAPGFYSPGGFPRATTSLATARAVAAFGVAVNFMIGVQVKL
jgi:hypothetical protein